MPIGAALIAGGSSLLGGILARNDRQTPENLELDQRTTTIDEMFSNDFMQSLTDQERTALEEQFATTTSDSTMDSTGSATTADVTTRGTAQSNAAINSILSGANSPDAEAAIQARMAQVLESGSPAIANSGNSAGSFDSTVKAQLQNDLAIQAAQAGAEMQLSQENQDIANIIAAISASQNASEGTTGTQNTTQSQSGTTNESTDSSTSVTENTTTAQEQERIQEGTNMSDSLADVGGSNQSMNTSYNPVTAIIANAQQNAAPTTGTPSTDNGQITIDDLVQRFDPINYGGGAGAQIVQNALMNNTTSPGKYATVGNYGSVPQAVTRQPVPVRQGMPPATRRDILPPEVTIDGTIENQEDIDNILKMSGGF